MDGWMEGWKSRTSEMWQCKWQNGRRSGCFRDLSQPMIFVSLLMSDNTRDLRHVWADVPCIQMGSMLFPKSVGRSSIPSSGWHPTSARSYQAHLFLRFEWIQQLATSAAPTHMRARPCIMMKWNVNNLRGKVESSRERTNSLQVCSVLSLALCDKMEVKLSCTLCQGWCQGSCWYFPVACVFRLTFNCSSPHICLSYATKSCTCPLWQGGCRSSHLFRVRLFTLLLKPSYPLE